MNHQAIEPTKIYAPPPQQKPLSIPGDCHHTVPDLVLLHSDLLDPYPCPQALVVVPMPMLRAPGSKATEPAGVSNGLWSIKMIPCCSIPCAGYRTLNASSTDQTLQPLFISFDIANAQLTHHQAAATRSHLISSKSYRISPLSDLLIVGQFRVVVLES